MARGGVIFNPDVQSDIDMKNTYKLLNYPGSILPSIPVSRTVFVDVNGNDTTAAAGDLYHPAQTFTKAVTLASSLTPTADNPVVIKAGPGTFTANSGFVLSQYVSLVGAGIDITIINSSRLSISSPIIGLNTGVNVEDITVNGTAADQFQNPFDFISSSATGMVLRRVKTYSDSDGFNPFSSSSGLFLQAYDCIFTSKYDAINVGNNADGRIEFYNCQAISTGPSVSGAGGVASGVVAGGKTHIYWYGGSVSADGAIAVTGINSSFETRVATTAVINIFGSKVKTGSTAGHNYDLNTSGGGAINYVGIARDDGAAFSTVGSNITDISRYVTKDNNLSDLVSTSTARTNLGLGGLATVTPGTGVATALAINVGTAGSLITNGGALGTPSSGTATNLTSLNASNLASGTVPTARLGSGTANATTFLRGDSTWSGVSSSTIPVTSQVLIGDGAGNATTTTETGTGDTVRATSPTLVTPTIGVATATSVNKWTLTAPSTAATLTAGADGLTYTLPEITTKIGFRHIPQNSQSAPYTTVLEDSGKHLYHPAADANNRTFTIDSNANVAYPIGTAIMFVNLSANNLSIAITADTMYLAGAGTTGTRTLAQYGKATAVKTGTTEWVISGVGLS